MSEILDSGNRREFESGAVRDMAKGKGRCDLLPLDVLCGDDLMLGYFAECQKTLDYSTVENTLWYFVVWYMRSSWEEILLELSIHYEQGAEKYGENNWQKGLPKWCYLDSAIRHYLKWKRGDTDERHERAVLWNLACLMWTIRHEEGE